MDETGTDESSTETETDTGKMADGADGRSGGAVTSGAGEDLDASSAPAAGSGSDKAGGEDAGGEDRGGEDAGGEDAGGEDAGGEDERLAALGDRIQSARAGAEEAVPGMDEPDEERFEESGSGPAAEQDDQTIAPP
ncbi:MAG: hypothetical protein ABR511_00635 [Acidimicrobiales bacterium]